MVSRTRIVGELACQRDSYLEFFETVVVSCVPVASSEQPIKSKSKSKGALKATVTAKGGESVVDNRVDEKLWEIEFEDSILFPEGGGQPTDYGSLSIINPTSDSSYPSSIPITRINRHGLRAVHFSPVPLPIGTAVRQSIDLNRRMDHMQQHTGQHLLSAVMDGYPGLETLGWSMGASMTTENESVVNMNFVELGRKPANEEIEEIQTKCNEIIRRNVQISVHTPIDAKTDSLPADYDPEKGIIRVIKIDGVDENPCCGTHLSQTSHIALILLHHTQPIRGTNTRLYFSCGTRAITLASSSVRALHASAGIVSSSINTPLAVVDAVQKVSVGLRDALRANRKLEVEIAGYEAEKVKRQLDSGKGAFVKRSEGGLDFINAVTAEMKDGGYDIKGYTILVTGEKGASGPIVVVGEEEEVKRAVERVKEVLKDSGVKGGGKGTRWQGKVTKWAVKDFEVLRELH